MKDKQMAYCEEEQKDVDYRKKKLKEQKDKISIGMFLYKWDKVAIAISKLRGGVK